MLRAGLASSFLVGLGLMGLGSVATASDRVRVYVTYDSGGYYDVGVYGRYDGYRDRYRHSPRYVDYDYDYDYRYRYDYRYAEPYWPRYGYYAAPRYYGWGHRYDDRRYRDHRYRDGGHRDWDRRRDDGRHWGGDRRHDRNGHDRDRRDRDHHDRRHH